MGLKSLSLPIVPELTESQHKRIQEWIPPPELVTYMQVFVSDGSLCNMS